jgi:hypothetical protein
MIHRYGYQKKKLDNIDCNIALVKYQIYSDSVATKIGSIKLGESGFSINCSETDAIKILKREGCSLGADIANIKKESRADIWSSCYRCEADFYKLINNKIIVKSDSTYLQQNVKVRVTNDRTRNIMIGGSLLLILTFLLLMK